MAPAVSVDGRTGPPLPREFKIPERRPAERKSPLPDEWSEPTRGLRDLFDELEKLFGG